MLDGMGRLAKYLRPVSSKKKHELILSIYQGRYFGSCGPMTGNSDGFSNDYKTFLRKYWEAQVTAAEAVQGWVYWTWKVRQAPGSSTEDQELTLTPG